MADFEYSDDPELRKLANQVREDPEDFDLWNKLVPLASSQEGGLNRNSSPAAITATRDLYDAFLRRFPLFFGYWSKYADLEFSIAGPEAAEMVYERGVASVVSVDLWSKYCSFKVETCHDNDVIRDIDDRTSPACDRAATSYVACLRAIGLVRAPTCHDVAVVSHKISPAKKLRTCDYDHLSHIVSTAYLVKLFDCTAGLHEPDSKPELDSEPLPLPEPSHKPVRPTFPPSQQPSPWILFERAVEVVGLDFQAHPLWDKYIEFEERIDANDRVFAVLGRLVRIPLHQYARYFERFRNMASTRPLGELESPEKLAELAAELKAELSGRDTDSERDLRDKLDAHFMNVYSQLDNEVRTRWAYESGAKRPYYLVTELEEEQLENWRKYLDYEEQQGDFKRIKMLYERCLVPAAHYEEFWFRIEEARNVYQRACALFVPISCPAIRLHYAFFEESHGHADTAFLIHESILDKVPNCLEAIVSLVNTYRRQEGVDVAIDTIKKYLEHTACPSITKGALASEWARLLLKIKGSVVEAREVYLSYRDAFVNAGDSALFWTNWLNFELEQANSTADAAKISKFVRSVIDDILRNSSLPLPVIESLASRYLEYLQERGGPDSMKDFLELDRELNGPLSISSLRKTKGSYDTKTTVVNGGQAHTEVVDPYTATGSAGPSSAVAPEKPHIPHPHIGPIPANGGQVSHTQTSMRWQSR
ncbi:hypothetical protein K431DRAFT_343028 [Polychaeton citri CBS 116435]|uniref:Pre-mRNA-processing factor 39 n=1 Tax=Polychaeton citri CBS 116435 TaxID=1314669 RepID=A0A9P4QIP2_9PEZI|nr:hypothetical protein K431DRAFT_343028 [Polychaeton citri CBS 116435]